MANKPGGAMDSIKLALSIFIFGVVVGVFITLTVIHK